MADPRDFAPGTFGCHEVLHMASFVAAVVDTELVDHPAIRANPYWYALALSARITLNDLHQAIGESHLRAEPSAQPEDAL